MDLKGGFGQVVQTEENSVLARKMAPASGTERKVRAKAATVKKRGQSIEEMT